MVSLQHVKDMLQIRKNDLDSYRRATKRAPKDSHQSSSHRGVAVGATNGPSTSDKAADNNGVAAPPPCPLTRERAVPVVKLLFSLLSRLDASCSSDTFLRTCKLIGHIMRTCRPTLRLAEAIQEEAVIGLLHRFASASLVSSLGEAWAGPYGLHAVACLFSDLLDAEEAPPPRGSSSPPPPPPTAPPAGLPVDLSNAPIALQEEPGSSPNDSPEQMSEAHSPAGGAQGSEMDFLKRKLANG